MGLILRPLKMPVKQRDRAWVTADSGMPRKPGPMAMLDLPFLTMTPERAQA